MNRGRSLDYTDTDRQRHYAGIIAKHDCPVCLAGMPASHGTMRATGRDDLANATGPGFRDGSTNPARDAASWSYYLDTAAEHRRDVVRRGRLTPHELATAASRFGIVADDYVLPITGAGTAVLRMHEAVAVYGSWRAQAFMDRSERAYRAEHGDHAGQARDWSVAGFRGWPGDVAADYDASAERFNLSPSGPWHRALPPIYAAAGIASAPGTYRP